MIIDNKTLNALKFLVKKLKDEKVLKKEWAEQEKREMKPEYQDRDWLDILTERITEIDLEVEILENTIEDWEAELKREASE